jgi:TolA-binding protein
LAFEERRYRELVTRFLEGMYTLQFGNAGAAADQMATALTLGQQSSGTAEQTGSMDAAVMLGQTDGFDAQVTLQDSVRAFKVLADIKAGRNEAALVECVRILVPGTQVSSAEDVKQTELSEAVNQIQSPLVGFAFASALEATINTLELEQIERRMLLLAATNAAFERVEQQLKSQRMQSRYPHIVSLVADARQQLSSTQGFLDKAYKLRSSGDLEGATNALVDGLKRHPQSTELWKLYLETQVLLVQRGDGVDDAFRKLLVRIERIEELNMISPFQKHFYCAVLHERLGDIQNSLQEYESAVVAAKQSRDRILARSKVSQLRVRDTVRN